MTNPAYFTEFANFALDRTPDGVMTVRMHTDGGPILFTGRAHADFPALLEAIALDPDNKAMVLTGTGNAFMDQIDGKSLCEVTKPAHWEHRIRTEGTKVLQRLIDLPIPVIGVANGPVTVHTEYLLLADITSRPRRPPTAIRPIRPSISPPETASTSSGRRQSDPRARSGCCGQAP
jgi:enoyl-CoA hydratase/carnithine racemase